MSVSREMKQAVLQHMKTTLLGQARFASLLGIGAGTINNLLRNRKPPISAVRQLDAFFERKGAWIAAFQNQALPRRIVLSFPLKKVRIFTLAEYASKKGYCNE